MSHSHIITQDAALIATFYGNRGQLQSLLQRLREGFTPLTEHAPNLWLHEARLISLRLFDPLVLRTLIFGTLFNSHFLPLTPPSPSGTPKANVSRGGLGG